MSRRVDLYISLFIVLIGAVYLWMNSQIFQATQNDPIGERGFPAALGLVVVIGGAVGAIRAFMNLRAEPEPLMEVRFNEPGDEEAYPASSTRPIVMWALCLVWVVTVEPVGYLIVTALWAGVELWLLGFRKPVNLVVLAVLGSFLTWFIFDFLLMINLPGGVLAPLTDGLHL